jgi:hypothetical protein
MFNQNLRQNNVSMQRMSWKYWRYWIIGLDLFTEQLFKLNLPKNQSFREKRWL